MRYFFGFLCLLLLGEKSLATNGEQVLPKNCPQVVVKKCRPCPPWWQTGWAITLYSGPLTFQTSSKLFKDFDFGNTGIIALAGAKKIGSVWQNQLDFELEAQAVQHFGKQKHFEINPIVLIARWVNFPWNCTLPTTLAIGDGLSIATQKPKGEFHAREHAGQVLNYVMAEITLSRPCSQWAVIARYHHRSGMFGVFNGVHDASTAFAAGIKYWF
jgi:hypothetical protein